NPYLSASQLFDAIAPGKQGIINVHECQNIISKLNLKAFNGGYKVMIIWRPELMNTAGANKMLKVIEEPPAKTLFILVSEKMEEIINTIKSRCQLIRVNKPKPEVLENWLTETHQVGTEKAKVIAALSDGNAGKAIQMIENQEEENNFLDAFMSLNRMAYK